MIEVLCRCLGCWLEATTNNAYECESNEYFHPLFYVRVENSNVEIVACPTHAAQLIERLRNAPQST